MRRPPVDGPTAQSSYYCVESGSRDSNPDHLLGRQGLFQLSYIREVPPQQAGLEPASPVLITGLYPVPTSQPVGCSVLTIELLPRRLRQQPTPRGALLPLWMWPALLATRMAAAACFVQATRAVGGF